MPPNPVSPKVAKKRKATNVEKDTILESSAEPNTKPSSEPSVELETGTPEKKRNRRGKKKKKSELKSDKTEDTGSEEPTLKDPVKEKEKVHWMKWFFNNFNYWNDWLDGLVGHLDFCFTLLSLEKSERSSDD